MFLRRISPTIKPISKSIISYHHIINCRGYSSNNAFSSNQTPHPPRLPENEQKEFEKLQRLANSQQTLEDYNKGKPITKDGKENTDSIGEFSPEYSPTIAEFEGDKNPKTGEIGGPKQDPTRHGDWSFNGRVTDF
ncbi:hypothetical protein TBLA_0D05240 [Henningerozyma blattae CBS 6284]|uniref:Succinate dehydrogenase assembly factor 4, mitochondrial n=1 Tax=Henningerozyma blattae (strain ATCC 34711 / CBS 6284 / DSM 70876 / NBRC 10599 / NRRL Y-10934 / UCD 77-7) TaxID=1071380 RepID=I2H3R5_HENB6|nr:hypothetical protein TBLA_0D05240 [Tetrapisispora blattae CBS 6284]CCH61017.1 hypothetical protein TBLA_0D05240 [Tetrapisispora blattae CBS 6284]